MKFHQFKPEKKQNKTKEEDLPYSSFLNLTKGNLLKQKKLKFDFFFKIHISKTFSKNNKTNVSQHTYTKHKGKKCM